MLTIVQWIHLSSMAVLVGGMIFVFFVLRPALSRHTGEPPMKIVSSFIRARFRWIAVLLTAVIIASGVLNIILAPPRKWYILLLILKVLLAGGVLFLYFRNAFAKVPCRGVPQPPTAPPVDAAKGTPAEKATEWKTAWLLAPTASQVKMELVLIGGALLVILLGVILTRCG